MHRAWVYAKDQFSRILYTLFKIRSESHRRLQLVGEEECFYWLKLLPAMRRGVIDAITSVPIDSRSRDDLESNTLLDYVRDSAAASNKTVLVCDSLHSNVRVGSAQRISGATRSGKMLYLPRRYFVVGTDVKEIHFLSPPHPLPTRTCCRSRHRLRNFNKIMFQTQH